MAITTIYGGTEYRSRLEARWAAFFDYAGWRHTYEPFDGNGYIPDFVLHGKLPTLVEIKPAITEADYRAPIPKLERGLTDHWAGRILILGVTPLPPDLPTDNYGQALGLLGELAGGSGGLTSWQWDAALLHTTDCGQLGFCHEYMSYAHSPCGCYDGNNTHPLDHLSVERMWAKATNQVKWKGAAA